MDERPTAEDVRTALLRSGFPFEMFVAREMARLGMTVNESTYFEDPGLEKLRELDLWAAFGQSYSRNGKAHGEAKWVVIIECKRSDFPWVLLSAESGGRRGLMLDLVRPTTRLAAEFENAIWRGGMASPLDAFRWEPSGRGLTVLETKHGGKAPKPSKDKAKTLPALGDEQDKDPPFNVARKLAEATALELGDFPQNLSNATWVYPILALDAPFFAASLNENNDLEVSETQTATMLSPPAKRGRRFPIIVTTKPAVPKVLAAVDREIRCLREAALGDELGKLQADLVQEHR